MAAVTVDLSRVFTLELKGVFSADMGDVFFLKLLSQISTARRPMLVPESWHLRTAGFGARDTDKGEYGGAA